MAAEPSDRAITALLDNVKSNTTLSKRVEILDHRFGTLEDLIDARMSKLEQEMGSMNAHLDNLVRGVGITNSILQGQLDIQQADKVKKDRQDEEAKTEKLMLRETEQKKNHLFLDAAKAPLGFILSGTAVYLLYHFLGVKITGWL